MFKLWVLEQKFDEFVKKIKTLGEVSISRTGALAMNKGAETEKDNKGKVLMKMYYEKDADANLIKSKKVAIVGFGSQGHAHALNLKDSGVKEIVVALRENSPSIKKAESAGLKVMSISDAAEWADVLMILAPDELQSAIYKNHVEQRIKQGASLAFAHGLNIHYDLIKARDDLDVFMIAPKGPGHLVRTEYQKGGGVPCLMAVHKDRYRKSKRPCIIICFSCWRRKIWNY